MSDELALRAATEITSEIVSAMKKRVADMLETVPEEQGEITPQELARAVVQLAGAVQTIAEEQHQIKMLLQAQSARNIYP